MPSSDARASNVGGILIEFYINEFSSTFEGVSQGHISNITFSSISISSLLAPSFFTVSQWPVLPRAFKSFLARQDCYCVHNQFSVGCV